MIFLNYSLNSTKKKFKVKSTVGGELSSRLVEPRTRCLEKNNN